MSEKPEALRLADELDVASLGIRGCLEALSAAELRRQHAEIERLREEVRNWKKSFVGHVYVKNEDYAELIGKRDALKTENERLCDELRQSSIDYTRAEIERLREVLNRFEYSSDGHIKRYPEEEEVIAALRREKT